MVVNLNLTTGASLVWSQKYGSKKKYENTEKSPDYLSVVCFYNIKPRKISLEMDQPIIKEWNKALMKGRRKVGG